MNKNKLMILYPLLLIIFSMSVLSFGVTLNSPVDSSWETSLSVGHDFTVNGNNTNIPWCALYNNRTGTQIVRANYSNVPNGTSFKRGIAVPATDGINIASYIICYDGHVEYTSGINDFGVDYVLPVVNLDSSNNLYLTSTATVLTYTPVDATNLDTCDVYMNVSGTFQINKTNTTVISGVQDDVLLSGQSDGNYIWNVKCNQSSGDGVWGDISGNYSFVIDTTAPAGSAFITTNNTISSDTTPLIKWNQSNDANFKKYVVLVATSIAGIDSPIVSEEITTITENSTTLSPLPTNDQYYIKIVSEDEGGLQTNSTSILYYYVQSSSLTNTLIAPVDAYYSSSSSVNFDVNVTDLNPETCSLLLSPVGNSNTTINSTDTSITSAALTRITVSDINDGVYKWNMECNNSINYRVNVSSSDLTLTVDTTSPTTPQIIVTWGQTNSTDATPILSWLNTTETNFVKYVVDVFNIITGNIEQQVNITTKSTTTKELSLTTGSTYNFSVTAYDLAGNTGKSVNTTSLWTYVDSVCGTLSAGWNLCGATWATSKNMSDIGAEMDATMLSVWNVSSHTWQTCNYGVTKSGTNCELNVGINNDDTHAVWVYVNESTLWEDRTWVATGASANVTLSNVTNGWNLEGMFHRNGRTLGKLANNYGYNMTSLTVVYNNGTTDSLINKGNFRKMASNNTLVDYGRGYWAYYNSTGDSTFDVGGW